jgi:hypothetical protein
MKNRVKGIVLSSAVLLWLVLPAAAQGGANQSAPDTPSTLGTGAKLNPLEIAQMKWYIANSSTAFPAGSQPYGLCFDGANIWAADFGSDTVGELRTRDGNLLGTFKVGNQPTESPSTERTSGFQTDPTTRSQSCVPPVARR